MNVHIPCDNDLTGMTDFWEQHNVTPPPPPTPLKPRMKVDFVWMWIPHMGNARNLRPHARPSAAPGAAAPGFHFQLEHARSRVVVCLHHARRKKALLTRCQLICWPLLPTFLGGLGTQPNKGRTSPWQMPAGQAGAANISWSASAGRRWCCCAQGFPNSISLLPSCGKSLFWMCMALVTSINMAGGACKCGVGSLVHRRSLIGVTVTRLFCALQRWCFLQSGWARPTQQPRECWVSRRIWHGRAFQPFVFLSWTYLRLGSMCKSRLSKQASRQEPITCKS